MDEIVKLVHNFFKEKLPKKGKPSKDKCEWTVISAFVLLKSDGPEIVSIGTGTKCLGQNETSPKGDLVHDSHAEVIAKRAFVLYLINQINLCQKGQNSVLEKTPNGKFQLKFPFVFYTSFPPCGDATIAPKEEENEPDTKKAKLDIYRTGAKNSADPENGEKTNFHVLGLVRTKPGRGDPTLSLSCSDKLAKWCHVGFQGTLLAGFFEKPLKPKTVIVGHKQTCLGSVKRALFSRFGFPENEIELCKTLEKFEFESTEEEQSCDASIFWNGNGNHGVVVQGKKLGCIKKHFGTAKAQSPICRLQIAQNFLKNLGDPDAKFETYQDLKNNCAKKSSFYTELHAEMSEKLGKTGSKNNNFAIF